MATATETKFQQPKLHHGYTRKQLQELGRKNADLCDSLACVQRRREWVFDHVKDIREGYNTSMNFKYYFIWKRSYRNWLEISVVDRKLGRGVLPLI